MTEFSDTHKRILLHNVRHLDGMLTDLEQKLASVGIPSPFHEYTMDLTEAQRNIVLSYIALIQETMIRFLERGEIPFQRQMTSILKVVKTTAIFMHMAAEEMRPKYIRGYGQLSDQAVRELNETASEIQALLRRLQDEL